MPMPTAATADGSSTESRKPPPTATVAPNSAMPTAPSSPPTRSSVPAPSRAIARVAITVPATTPAQNGRNALPAAVGP
ncbi:hypothetical protein [Streptomyces sp. NPDC052015]|uniref:hypothetical protein n=1 Tax=Streptomyces sp. NPDC052015 TaxID=3154755 RepID=UPI0034442DED